MAEPVKVESLQEVGCFPKESLGTLYSLNRTVSRMKEKNIHYLLQTGQINTYAYNGKLENRGIVSMIKKGHFREYEVPLDTDKIFCSQWLSDRAVIFGTKCNKLLVYDVIHGLMEQIPSLKGSKDVRPLYRPCGIHAIAVNPSRTLLATGGLQSNIVAVYSLPSFDPVCCGDGAHNDWIFDIKWLDDEFFVTCSRDNMVALWKVPPIRYKYCPGIVYPCYSFIKPKIVQACSNAEKVRGLAFRPDYDLAAVSLNGYLHIFDLETFQQRSSNLLPHPTDTICLSYCEEKNVYVIGSQRHVVLLDPSNLTNVIDVEVRQPTFFGIRSLYSKGNILSVGTAAGHVMFYDTRVGTCMEDLTCPNKNFILYDMFSESSQVSRPAVFSHSYDPSGTRIFVGGGPLSVDLYGCYAAVWQ